MKKAICVLLLLTASSLLAQDKNPVTSAVKEILPRQQKNLVGAADEMPAATLVLFRRLFTVFIRPDRDVLRAVVGGEVRAA